MTVVRLRYAHRFRDRYGAVRWYLRRPGFPLVRLPGAPGSPEFMAAYQAALAMASAPVAEARDGPPGSFAALVVSVYRSPGWSTLARQSQDTYRRLLERLRAQHGAKPVQLMEPRHVRQIVTEIGRDAPAQANRVLSLLRMLMRHAIESRLRDDDPTRDVRRVRYRKRPFAAWTEEQIAWFEERWPVGTRARLAFDLLLYTGQRRSDVIHLGPQHLAGGKMRIVQQKTGAELLVPIHPALRASLEAAAPARHLAFLITELGHPFASANAFYQWFKLLVVQAGLPTNLSPHGLRKAAARRLAEAGCTPHEIAAITGHATLAEVQRYTRSADRSRLAEAAIVRLRPRDEA